MKNTEIQATIHGANLLKQLGNVEAVLYWIITDKAGNEVC